MGRPPAADLLAVAEEAARAAGSLLVPRFGSEPVLASKSTPTDVVSEADFAAERAIRAVLDARRPDDGVLGEEGTGDVPGTTGLCWVVDPLDGTVNYLYGVAQWCVSVAVRDATQTLAGVVLDPLRDECFAATHDGPPFLNGATLEPAGAETLESALLATGFGYDSEVRRAQAAVIAELLPRVRDIRRAGSAALDLCGLAAGRHDLYFERGVKPWDIAAGALICERAGLVVADLPAVGPLPYGVAAGRAELLEQLLGFIRPGG